MVNAYFNIVVNTGGPIPLPRQDKTLIIAPQLPTPKEVLLLAREGRVNDGVSLTSSLQ